VDEARHPQADSGHCSCRWDSFDGAPDPNRLCCS
jgi:hypothetical protein